jgi:hypothetical protein
MSKMARCVATILALLGFWTLAAGAAEPKRAALSEQDKADVTRAESYLNGITTLKARFLQISPNGAAPRATPICRGPAACGCNMIRPARCWWWPTAASSSSTMPSSIPAIFR